ncbi:MAG: YceI family protein [bacterium]|nr:YceI family protein [bacterium]
MDARYTRVVDGRVVPVAGEWVIDGLHSSVAFAARHLLTAMRGRFRDVSGTVTIAEVPEHSKADVRIAAASIDTTHPKADEHLRGPLFLDVERYPVLTFSGSGAHPAGGELWDVAGELTVRDVTLPLVLSTRFLGAVSHPHLPVAKMSFEATASLRRDHFGVAGYLDTHAPGLPDVVLVGREVEIRLDVEADLHLPGPE